MVKTESFVCVVRDLFGLSPVRVTAKDAKEARRKAERSGEVVQVQHWTKGFPKEKGVI